MPREHVDKPVQGKEYRVFLSHWREPILLWSGHNKKLWSGHNKKRNQLEYFFEKLITLRDNCGGYYFLESYFLASSITAEFYSEYSDKVILRLIEWDLESEDSCLPSSTSVKSARNEALLEADHKILIEKLKNKNQTTRELEPVLIKLKLKNRQVCIPWASPPSSSVKLEELYSIIPESGTFNGVIQKINDINVLVDLLKSPMILNSLLSELRIIE
ncbi:MAG: hypothetical protein OHK0037_11040 [Elainellaceae cyanobacterium]